MQMAYKEGKQVIACVGELDENLLSAKDFSVVTKDKISRAKFYKEIQSILDKFNLNGLMLQWFYPGCHDYVLQYNCYFIIPYL